FYSFKHPWTPASSTLSLHDALPICLGEPRDHAVNFLHDGRAADDRQVLGRRLGRHRRPQVGLLGGARDKRDEGVEVEGLREVVIDRKSTRLNSSHDQISYAVFCLKK